MRHHAKSFSRAARFFPPRYADPVAVLYAFCRMADDAVDEAPDSESARRAAAALSAELDAPETARPVIRAFDVWSERHPLARLAARELLAGIASDIDRVRVADRAELVRYAYRVAGTVGLMMCAALDVDDERAYPFAIDLGVAMQLTNIARDVAEDATRDRVYLPADVLARYGASAQAVVEGRASATSLAPVVLWLLDEADAYYASAERGMPYLPAAARPAILVAARLYRAIGEVLRRRGGNPLAGRAWVTTGEQIPLIVGALARSVVIGIKPRGEERHDGRLHEVLRGMPGIGG
jgi:phytoene synthase